MQEFSTTRLTLEEMARELNPTIRGWVKYYGKFKRYTMRRLNKQDMMTIAKRIEQRGMQKGRQEGMQEGILETAKNFIKQGVTLDIIAKATGLSKEALAQLA